MDGGGNKLNISQLAENPRSLWALLEFGVDPPGELRRGLQRWGDGARRVVAESFLEVKHDESGCRDASRCILAALTRDRDRCLALSLAFISCLLRPAI